MFESTKCRDWSSTETSRSARFGVLKDPRAYRTQTEFGKQEVNSAFTYNLLHYDLFCDIYETNDRKGTYNLNTLW